jgi:hypothetical protein
MTANERLKPLKSKGVLNPEGEGSKCERARSQILPKTDCKALSAMGFWIEQYLRGREEKRKGRGGERRRLRERGGYG